MADREGVESASGPITALTMLGLAGTMGNGIARLPFVHPFRGPGGLADNLGQTATRLAIRAFMGYTMSLSIPEFRSMERVLDQICSGVMPPIVGGVGKVELVKDTVGGVEGVWCRPKPEALVDDDGDPVPLQGTILYLHGGGYIGTTPMMYTAFAAALVRLSNCEVFIADYRMAPEFPFPAGIHDAADVYRALLEQGTPAEHLMVAGDSGGGGLATSLLSYLHAEGLPRPAALALFSPEIDLDLSQDSMTANADSDVLPWSIPVAPYLHGVQPNDNRVSAIYASPDTDWFPPTFVCWGEAEMFRDSIRDFAARLAESEVPVHAMEELGMFHVFPILMPWAESSKRVFRSLSSLAGTHVRPATRRAVAEPAQS
ncbi:acetyl esterase/lipase [Gordonia humi]|uniref:Acetyl esterase/lipase n=2 Tax=Gordonia humi TaxID=686429 RepID=A0A840F4L0_9ACTN|nr:acetyl esterase/lipase [Gordonia humi]